MKSETFRKQALSLIVFFVAIAAVFALTRLRSDPAGKQAQTILTQLLSSSDAVEPAADDSYTASKPGLVQVDDGGFAAFYQAQFGDCMTQTCLEKLLLYMFEHREAFHLLLLCSEGTRYSSMRDALVQLEINATHRYYRVLEKLGTPAPQIDPRLEHILVTGLMNAYFEMIIHDMPLTDAQQYLQVLHSFYSAGWLKIMGQ